MVVIFDFRASRHGKTKLAEETFNTVNGTCDRMQTAVLNTAPRQGDIDGFSGQAGVKRCAFQLGFTRVKSLLYLLFRGVNDCPGCRTLFRRQIA